jgi:hypothetical protein
MNAAPVHCYVYYRIDPLGASSARRTIALVQEGLEEGTGVTGRLLQGKDDPLLWMEVYENVLDPARFEVTLADLLATHRFSQFLAPGSMRRIERFVANSASG